MQRGKKNIKEFTEFTELGHYGADTNITKLSAQNKNGTRMYLK